MTDPDAVAALDCGTNSTRLLVVDASRRPSGRVRCASPASAQGVDATRQLRPEAIGAHARRAARVPRDRWTAHGVGASAPGRHLGGARRRQRRGVPRAPRRESSGCAAELLTGDEEGRLSYRRGDRRPAARATATVVVVDIGGGSTELVTRRGRRRSGRSRSTSAACGSPSASCAAIRPRAGGADAARRRHRASELDGRQRESPRWRDRPTGHGSSAWPARSRPWPPLEQGLADYDRDRIHHCGAHAARPSTRWCDVLGWRAGGRRGRRARRSAGREDVIVGGALVLARGDGRLGCDQCIVSESDILDGPVMSILPE